MLSTLTFNFLLDENFPYGSVAVANNVDARLQGAEALAVDAVDGCNADIVPVIVKVNVLDASGLVGLHASFGNGEHGGDAVAVVAEGE